MKYTQFQTKLLNVCLHKGPDLSLIVVPFSIHGYVKQSREIVHVCQKLDQNIE